MLALQQLFAPPSRSTTPTCLQRRHSRPTKPVHRRRRPLSRLLSRFGAGGSWPDWRCCCSATRLEREDLPGVHYFVPRFGRDGLARMVVMAGTEVSKTGGDLRGNIETMRETRHRRSPVLHAPRGINAGRARCYGSPSCPDPRQGSQFFHKRLSRSSRAPA